MKIDSVHHWVITVDKDSWFFHDMYGYRETLVISIRKIHEETKYVQSTEIKYFYLHYINMRDALGRQQKSFP